MIDEKAFQKAFEATNQVYAIMPPTIRKFIEAYESAKEQPKGEHANITIIREALKSHLYCHNGNVAPAHPWDEIEEALTALDNLQSPPNDTVQKEDKIEHESTVRSKAEHNTGIAKTGDTASIQSDCKLNTSASQGAGIGKDDVLKEFEDWFAGETYPGDAQMYFMREAWVASRAAMPRPATGPTEAMCNEARGFILGLDLNIQNFADMEKHLDRGGYSCIPYIREMAAHGQGSSITKWDVADCIWQLMAKAQPINQPPTPEGDV